MLPPSKLQQCGVADGIALLKCVGIGLRFIFTTHSPGPQFTSQLVLLLLQYSPFAQVLPPSKLQQDGVLEGIVLGCDVGIGVGCIISTHSPGEHEVSQLLLLLLQNEPFAQVSPPSKLQHEGASDGIALGINVGEVVGILTHFPGAQ